MHLDHRYNREDNLCHILRLFTHKDISIEDKKRYIDSFHSTVCKFNNSIGYKKLYDTAYEEVWNEKKEEYEWITLWETPRSLIFNNLRTPYESNNIAIIYLPQIRELNAFYKNKINKKDLTNEQLIIKFKIFLNKVYPELEADISIGLKPDYPLVDFTIDYFSSNINKEDKCTLEFSASRLLQIEELALIKSKIQPLSIYDIEVGQHFCNTCYGYNKDKPYHIKLEYK